MNDLEMAWLSSLGYRAAFRNNGWVECLLLRSDERWLGTGIDEAEAFANALHSALPSEAARRAFELAISARRHLPEPVPSPEPTTPGPASPPPAETEPIPTTLEVPAGDSPAPDPTALPTEPEKSAAVAVVPELGADADCPQSSIAAAVVIPSPDVAPTQRNISAAEGRAELQELQEVIRANFVEASLLEPQRQRLLLTQWMARARAIEDALPSDRSIHDRVYQFSQELGKLAKVWWPGQVRVLAKWNGPGDCRVDVGLGPEDEVEGWETIENAAAAQLERIEDAASTSTRDELGWCDGPALYPGPNDPASLYHEIREAIEACTQPDLRRPEDAVHTEDLRPSLRDKARVSTMNWSDIAGKVRWLRGSVHDMELWGAAIGRLRWLAQHDKVVARSIERLLDPEYVPPVKWRQHLGIELRLREASRGALLKSIPAAGCSDRDLTDWLVRALDLADALPNEEIAACLRQHKQRIVDLRDGDLPERRHRRRLRGVKKLLGADPANGPQVESVHASVPEVQAPPELTENSRTREHQLAEALRPHTRGARVLFVSNRTDPERDRQLESLLELETIDSCLHDPGRIDAKVGSIRAGTYRFVFAATGFLPHSADGALNDACRLSGSRYVRVNRGRILQCLLHLARELGVATDSRATSAAASL